MVAFDFEAVCFSAKSLRPKPEVLAWVKRALSFRIPAVYFFRSELPALYDPAFELPAMGIPYLPFLSLERAAAEGYLILTPRLKEVRALLKRGFRAALMGWDTGLPSLKNPEELSRLFPWTNRYEAA